MSTERELERGGPTLLRKSAKMTKDKSSVPGRFDFLPWMHIYTLYEPRESLEVKLPTILRPQNAGIFTSGT